MLKKSLIRNVKSHDILGALTTPENNFKCTFLSGLQENHLKIEN